MSISGRVRNLLDSHGHSYKDAEAITNGQVSRETIRRICSGHNPPKLRLYLRLLAEGYGIDETALLEGASPKGEFEWLLRQAAPAQRMEWLLMTSAQRVKVTLDFLRHRYPGYVKFSVLGPACGLSESKLRSLVERWDERPPEHGLSMRVANALHELTGISLAWFEVGGLSDHWEPHKCLTRLASMARFRWAEAPSTAPRFRDILSGL